MANVKITELSAIANPASTDVLAIVDVTADITKKVTIADLLENAGDGTAAAPAFSFDSDPNTGVFLEAADKLGFSTNGTGRIYIDATGNVGIAKSNPTQTLDVNGTAAISGALTQGGNNVVTVGDTGTVTSTMIADGTIVNADVSATAEISVSKLANGTARQLLQTDAAGTGVEFTSNVDVPGTLDVTGVAIFDDNVTVGGNLTVNGTTTTIDSTTLVVEDRNIEMGAVATPTDVTADGGGITLKGATDKTINWVNSTDAWTLSEHVNIASAKEYRINGTKVLDATSLGSAVVSSSLTSVGTIGTGVWNGTPIATAYIADSSVTSAKIADGTIVDADVNASAAIGLNKLATGALPTGITVASANIVDATIVDADISGTAEISVSKLASGTARQLLQTNAAGTGVQFTSNVDVPGTLDVTGVAVFDSNIGVGTNSPGKKLHVVDSNNILRLESSSTNASRIEFENTASSSSDSVSLGSVSNDMQFVTSGSEKMRITSVGNCGINNSTPFFKLDVDAQIRAGNNTGYGFLALGKHASEAYRNWHIASEGNGYLSFFNGNDGSGDKRLTIGSNGSVGVGTSSPSMLLDVQGASNPQIKVSATNTGTNSAGLYIENQGQRNWQIWADRSSDQLRIGHNSRASTVLTITDSRVGIGLTSPASTLHLQKDIGAIINLGTGTTNANSVQGLNFYGRFVSGNTPALPGQLTSYIREERQGSTAAFELTFGTATTSDATERMRIDSSGFVGIGTTNPGSNLHVIGDIKTEGTFLALPFNGSSEGGEIQVKNPDATSNGAILDVSSANTFRVFQLNNNSLMQLGQLGGTGGTITLHTSGQERFRVNNLGNCGIGTSAPIAKVTSLGINSGGEGGTMCIQNTGAGVNTRVALYLTPNNGGGNDLARTAAIKSRQDTAGNYANLEFYTSNSAAPERRMTISSDGKFFINTTDDSLYANNASNQQGLSYVGSEFGLARWSDNVVYLNRMGTDGDILRFLGQGTSEGSINVSGTSVSLLGAHLSRWSQLAGNAERIEILRGTVLSNLDEMCEWGDEDNEQLNRMQVSDVEGDRNVAGVFQSWDDDDDTYTNDFHCAMTGDFVIRIAQGTTVARGDLLMSAGDGTAKPQDDDLVRSKTIAKVTSTTVSVTYADGSYCVPCVLMAC